MFSHWYSRLASAAATLALGAGTLFISGCGNDCNSCSDNDNVQPVPVNAGYNTVESTRYRTVEIRPGVQAIYDVNADRYGYYDQSGAFQAYGQDWYRDNNLNWDRSQANRDFNSRNERFNNREADLRNDARARGTWNGDNANRDMSTRNDTYRTETRSTNPVESTTKGAVNTAGHTAQGAVDTAGSAVHGATNTASDTVNSITGH